MKPQAQLTVEMVPTDELVMYEGNAKLHPSEQVDQIAASIEEFNFADPIAAWHDKDGNAVIVEGHGRLMAAKKLGIEQLPVIYLDYLTDEQRRAYTLVHNKLTMNSDFDFEILQNELDSIFDIDMGDFGFDVQSAIEDMIPKEIEQDEIPDNAPTICKTGDVWQLGRHRLMCGDSTNADNVATLMDGNRADICFTSPPYNMSAGGTFESAPEKNMGGGKNMYNVYTDNLTDDDYSQLLIDALDNALNNCDDAFFNIGIIKGSKRGIFEMMASKIDNFCDVLVWKKRDALPMGMESQKALVKHICELVFCFNQKGNRAFSHAQWEKGCGTNLIETSDNLGNDYCTEHHATFPVSFAASVIRDFTDSSVLDLFGGTGTTLIAAEQLNRTCYMMELDPYYCDIIIKRWEDFTGEKAVNVTNG